MKKGDIFGFGDKNYIVTGKPVFIGNSQLGEIRSKGPVKKVTLYIGLNRGIKEGKCKTQPKKYAPQVVVDTFLNARELQTNDPSKVGATVTPAKGVFQGGGEDTRVIEVLYEKNNKEQTFSQFKNNMLIVGEALSKRFCQQEILAIVKNGTHETRWSLTPKEKK